MADMVTSPRRATIDPLKHSPALGGAMAFLGLHRTMPLVHGSQGCAAFAKSLLTRHFREPIPMQTTALTQVTTVLGGGGALAEALATITAEHTPAVIGLLTTGLTEVSGDDTATEVSQFAASHDGPDDPVVIHASTPDFKGGMQDGWAAATQAMVSTCAEPGPVVNGQVNILAGPALSPLDVEELRLLVEAFGLDAVVIPDLAGSLDGHLADRWSALTTGGNTVADLRRSGFSQATLATGSAVSRAAETLEKLCGVPALVYDRLSGLESVDALVSDLADISGRSVPRGVRRWRQRLADGLLDTHFVLGGVRVALALEPDLLLAVGSLMADVGAEIVTAVSPTRSRVLGRLPVPEVVVGDLADFEQRSADGGAELVIGSSHVGRVAEQLDVPHLRMGFPVYDRLAAQLRLGAGYRGSLSLLADAANCLLEHRGTRHGASLHVKGARAGDTCSAPFDSPGTPLPIPGETGSHVTKEVSSC